MSSKKVSKASNIIGSKKKPVQRETIVTTVKDEFGTPASFIIPKMGTLRKATANHPEGDTWTCSVEWEHIQPLYDDDANPIGVACRIGHRAGPCYPLACKDISYLEFAALSEEERSLCANCAADNQIYMLGLL